MAWLYDASMHLWKVLVNWSVPFLLLGLMAYGLTGKGGKNHGNGNGNARGTPMDTRQNQR